MKAPTASATAKRAAERRTVTLQAPLMHRRVLLPPGATVELRPDQVERLRKQGIVA